MLPVKTREGACRDHVKANPGKYSFASSGTGTTPQLVGELFKLTYKLDPCTCRSAAAARRSSRSIGGHTPLAFTSLSPAVPHIKDGKLRALAVTSKPRRRGIPGRADAGRNRRSGQEADTIQAMLVPADTPKDIVDLRLSEVVKASSSCRT